MPFVTRKDLAVLDRETAVVVPGGPERFGGVLGMRRGGVVGSFAGVPEDDPAGMLVGGRGMWNALLGKALIGGTFGKDFISFGGAGAGGFLKGALALTFGGGGW